MGPDKFYYVKSKATVKTSTKKAKNGFGDNTRTRRTVTSTRTNKTTKVVTRKVTEVSVTKKIDKTITVTKQITEVMTPLKKAKATKTPIKIGWITDASSVTKSTYYPEYEGATLFFKALNDHGGVNGHPVEILMQDMKIDQATAVAAANKLLKEDNVLMLAVSTLEGRLPALFDITRTVGAPMLTGHSARPDIFPPNADPWLFSVGNVFEAMSDARVQLWPQMFGKEFPNGGTSACYIHEAPAAVAVCNRWLEQQEKATPRWKPGTIAKAPLSASDFTSYVRPVVDSNPTVFFDISIASHAVGVAVSARNLGYKGPIAFSMTATPETEIRTVAQRVGGDNLYAVSNVTSIDERSVPEVKQVVAAAKKYGKELPATSATINGWIMGQVIADSAARCGDNCSRQGMRDSMEKLSLDVTGLFGGLLQYSPDDHLGKRYWTGYKWDVNKRKLVRMLPGWTTFTSDDLLVAIK
jgi:ABC-type branched-subunit amino acid transport system substrate-binding protein